MSHNSSLPHEVEGEPTGYTRHTSELECPIKLGIQSLITVLFGVSVAPS